MMDIEIKNLADAQEFVPHVAKLYYDFGRQYDPNMNIDNVIAKLSSSLGTDHIPCVYAAIYKNQAIATVALQDSIPIAGYEHQDLWVRYLVVDSQYQKQGIGTYILEYACMQARELGYSKLCLFTTELDAMDWYISKGWLTFGVDVYRGRPITLLEYYL